MINVKPAQAPDMIVASVWNDMLPAIGSATPKKASDGQFALESDIFGLFNV
jgi:hypothetical protein